MTVCKSDNLKCWMMSVIGGKEGVSNPSTILSISTKIGDSVDVGVLSDRIEIQC